MHESSVADLRASGFARVTRRLLLTLVLFAAVGIAGPARAADPAGFVTDLGNKALAFLNEKQLSPAEREKRFRTIFTEGFDLEGISRFVLGPYWRSADETQRKEFLRLFEDYIVQAYTVRLSDYSGETFKIVGARPEGDAASLVASQIVRPNGAPPVKVDWRVNTAGGALKISDVVVEGVSMALTQKQEFASVIQRNGGQLDALLKLLRDKLKG